MVGPIPSARTRPASGRLLCLVLLAACLPGGPDTVSPGAELPSGPVVTPGPITLAEQREAAELYGQAVRSLEANRNLEALRYATRILDGFSASDVSGPAMLLSARAELGAGAVERADATAERYVGLLPPGDPRAAEARLIQAEALAEQPIIQLDRLLRIGPGARAADLARATGWVRDLSDSLSVDELRIAAESAPPGGAASPPLYARLSAELLALGQDGAARDYANAALDAGALGGDRLMAEGVLRGELPDGLRPARVFQIATVLPFDGPPALADFATSIAEGVEVAVATRLGDDFQVSVAAYDDEGDPELAAQLVAELEAAGTPGVIGFLLDEALLAGAAARTTGVPIVSPTARSAGFAGEAAYSLEGADPQAAEAVALYAVERAFQRVAMIYPDTPEASQEADAFAAVAESFGIPIVGRFPYPEGATDFEAQFRLAQDSLRAGEIRALGLMVNDTLDVDILAPVGLFMPVPAEDVPFVGPQFAHHGLDTLAIEVVGTSGWSDSGALESVDVRLLEGFVVTAPVGGGPGTPGYAAFQQAYERHFQRSLVSSTPAIGYDAASILLEALRPGRLRALDVRRALEQLDQVEGATGVFSIVNGRIVRQTEVVRITNGQLVPVPRGF